MPDQPNPNPAAQGGEASDQEQQGQDQPTQQQQQAQSNFDSLMAKKGWKSNDDVAKSYTELEQTYGKSHSAMDKVRKQLEAYGYSVDENGAISTGGQPQGQPAQIPGQSVQIPGQYQQPQQQPYQQGVPPEPIYDPYTGQQLTDPVDIQLAQMPPSQRTGVVVNAIINQREGFQRDAFTAEQEILSDPKAKGFEDDVRKAMMQVPLHLRAKKESWEDALLRVKGARYEEGIKNAGGQAVDGFVNKGETQPIPGAGAGGAGDAAKLTADQEAQYAYYKEHYPNMFKDKKHFLSRTKSTGA